MKFYNPFKPHIVTDGGRFAVRKYELFLGWVYFDRCVDYWWFLWNYVQDHATMDTKEEALRRLNSLKNKKVPVFPKSKWRFIK